MAGMPSEKVRRAGFEKRGYTFGTGGMPMAPPPPGGMPPPPGAGGNPAAALQQHIAAVPAKDRGKVKKLIAGQLKSAIKAQKAGGGAPPMPPPGAGAPPPAGAMPPPPPGPPGPPGVPGMKKGGKVARKAIGGAVRGVGAARKGGGRGRFV